MGRGGGCIPPSRPQLKQVRAFTRGHRRGELSLTWFEPVTLDRTLTPAAARLERDLIRRAPEYANRGGGLDSQSLLLPLHFNTPPPTPAPINHLGFKIFTCCPPVSVTTFRGLGFDLGTPGGPCHRRAPRPGASTLLFGHLGCQAAPLVKLTLKVPQLLPHS